VGQLAQLRVAALGVLQGLGQEQLHLSGVLAECLPGELEGDDGVHEPLLRAVVEIAHHTPSRRIARP
jgi:hypothetical protein